MCHHIYSFVQNLKLANQGHFIVDMQWGNTELCERVEVVALKSLTVFKKKWQWEGIFWTGDTEQYFLLVAAQCLSK